MKWQLQMATNSTCWEFVTPKVHTTTKMPRLCSYSMVCWLIVMTGLFLEVNLWLSSLREQAMMLGLVIIEEPDTAEVMSSMTLKDQLMASTTSTIASTSLVSSMRRHKLIMLESKLNRIRFLIWVTLREQLRCLWLWQKTTVKWMTKSTSSSQWRPLSISRIPQMHYSEVCQANGNIWFHSQTYLTFMRLI